MREIFTTKKHLKHVRMEKDENANGKMGFSIKIKLMN